MMLRISVGLAAILALVPTAISQAPIWGQCGGQGFTGPTICVSGSACYYENPYFSNCFPTSTSPEGANTVATTLGGKLYFGTAVANYELNDPAYAALLNNNSLFGQITPESLGWDATESVQGFFTFDEGDALVALAKKNGQLVRGPPCISYSQLPNWINTLDTSGSNLWNFLVNHCSTLVKHYADAWDIVVDPFTDDGFTRPVGVSVASSIDPTYIDAVLTAARAADPAAKLYIAATGMDTPGQQLTSMVGEVQWLQEHGIPIDGVGFQSHFTVGGVPSKEALMANYQNFTSLGIEVAVTVLDIRGGPITGGSDTLQQQTDYQTVISACKAVPGCVGVTLADISDKYSDVPIEYSGSGSALPWDNNFVAKPAYNGIIAGFTN
ncbi:endo-1,4-beta-xylanase A precursor [Mycena haematopus]|nr:endo-1,4-beta-xylanase A precursor [Mycena haematopus]